MTVAAKVEFQSRGDVVSSMLDRLTRAGLDHAAKLLLDRVKKSLAISNNLGLNPSPVGSPPGYGIGDLLKGLYMDAPNPLTRRVISGAVQSRLQEYGGLVTVQRKKWLTIPLSDEAKAHKTRGRNSMSFPRPLFFMRGSTPDTALLVERKKDGLFPHYVLRKSVYLPARPFMRPAAHDPEFRRMAVEGFRGQVRSAVTTSDPGVTP